MHKHLLPKVITGVLTGPRMFARRKAEAILRSCALSSYGPAGLAKNLAIRAVEQDDYEAALMWWTQVASRRADWSVAVVGRARALRAQKRLDEARGVLDEGFPRFPADPALIIELGWLLLDRYELDEALPVWRRAIALASGQPESHVGLATTLRQMLRFNEADAVLAGALQLFPDSCFVFSNHAVSADVRGDRLEALQRWQEVSLRFPGEAIGFAGLGAALKALGRFDEADRVLAAGIGIFPGDANIAINHAWVAVAAADWPEAIRRWSSLRLKWPADARVKAGLSEATMQAKLAAADTTLVVRNDYDVSASDGQGFRELMLCFESIGENCELGFVQRHFDVEPLGLFRWAGISYAQLLDALDNDLAGIGSDENTMLGVNPNNREFFTEDSRYGMSLHSFILEGSVDPAMVKLKLCRRLTYLKEKTIDDLRDGSKIFTFNSPVALSDGALRRLQEGLSKYRPTALLHVAPHDDLAPGMVAEVGVGLWRGSLGRTGYNGRIWDIEFDHWLKICQTVKRLNDAVLS